MARRKRAQCRDREEAQQSDKQQGVAHRCSNDQAKRDRISGTRLFAGQQQDALPPDETFGTTSSEITAAARSSGFSAVKLCLRYLF